ncbi:MAG TPA: LPS-assembly protein LptD, partial [Gammaproteobacteria bacterium]|nr:LPS-assembly protein LptD [Gammaproteobacteria bacterium]
MEPIDESDLTLCSLARTGCIAYKSRFGFIHQPSLKPLILRRFMFVFFRFALPAAGLLPVALSAAGPDWSFCRSGVASDTVLDELPKAGEATRVTADSLNSSSRDSLLFDGAVEVRGQGRLLKADRVRVFDEPKRFEATGDIEIRAPGLLIRSDSAMLSEADKRGVFDNVEYELPENHAFGRATQVETRDNRLTLNSASYSSCEVKDPDWVIKAGRIKLDRDAGLGTASNAMLKFMGVPLIYLPYITFPIDNQRRTGFLYPVIGSGNVAGATLSTPFYWNMAPNYDMTITPRFMEKRGVMAEDDIRYLGKRARSKVHLEYLKHDRVLNTERYNVAVDHENQLSRHWKLQVQGSYVSDFDYLTDFSNGLDTSSRTHLERYAQLVYHSRHWKGVVRSQVYQTIDPTIPLAERPYRRLPQITAEGDLPFLHDRLNLRLATDITRFTHDNAIEGRRYDFAPTLDYRWVTPGAFVKPSLAWHYTYYDLDPFAESEGEVIKRDLPVASIDSGLILERS